MATLEDVQAKLNAVQNENFYCEPCDDAKRAMYSEPARLNENVPFASCDGYCSLNNHPYEYGFSIDAVAAGLAETMNIEEAIGVLAANGVTLDSSRNG
jgi:hypothetical protein